MAQGSSHWRRLDRIQDKTFDLYLDNIGKYPLIDAAEEARLARRIRAGNKAALHALVQAHLRFVVKVAKHFTNQGVSLYDLVNAGNIGLIEAAKRFDETRGFRFISYAVWWVRQGMYICLAQTGRIYTVPTQRATARFTLNKAASALAHTLLRDPSAAELADKLGLPLAEVEASLALVNGYESLDEVFSNSDSSTLHDILEDTSIPDPAEKIDQEVLRVTVHAVVASLPPRECLVVTAHYGLDGSSPCTLEMIGELFSPHITREAVRQILEKAKRRIQTRLHVQTLSALTTPKRTAE